MLSIFNQQHSMCSVRNTQKRPAHNKADCQSFLPVKHNLFVKVSFLAFMLYYTVRHILQLPICFKIIRKRAVQAVDSYVQCTVHNSADAEFLK